MATSPSTLTRTSSSIIYTPSHPKVITRTNSASNAGGNRGLTRSPSTSNVAPSSIAQSSGKYDYLMKLIVIGDSGVGKSCLLVRFADDTFSHSFISTIGIDFKVRTMKVDDKVVKLQLYDTAGQERFRTITTAYYRGSHGILLVYDVTDERSFQNVRSWISSMPPIADTACKLIIGNKCDMEDKRAVSTEMGQQFAKELGLSFVETSAKANTNIELAFYTIVKEIEAKLMLNKLSPKTEKVLDVKENEAAASGKCAC